MPELSCAPTWQACLQHSLHTQCILLFAVYLLRWQALRGTGCSLDNDVQPKKKFWQQIMTGSSVQHAKVLVLLVSTKVRQTGHILQTC